MARSTGSKIAHVAKEQENEILQEWMRHQLAAVSSRDGAISDETLREESRRFLLTIQQGLSRDGIDDPQAAAWDEARQMLGEACP